MSRTMKLQKGLPYRRRLFLARHRRRSPILRLIKPFLVALALVGSPAALTAWVLTSPEFSLRSVEVEGADHVSEGWIENELSGLRGFPLFDIPIELLEGRLASHPWVASAQVRKRLPDRLLVELTERRPVALLQEDGELHFVDPTGIAFAPFDPSLGIGDLLLLSGSATASDLRSAMRLAAKVDRVAPRWSEGLSEVEILRGGDFRIYCAALPFPLVVSEERLVTGLESLRARLSEIEPHLASIGAIDLRFERYIVVQPAKER